MDSLKGTLTPMKVLQGTLNGGIAYGTFNYNELENKPSINGTELVGNVTIDIPDKTSDLDNDSGFITNADVPTKTSELTNDSGFITNADVPTKTSDLTNDSGFITSEDIPTIPTATSQLNNDSGFLTMLTTPVKSVNSQTGDVNLFIPNATSQLTNDAGFLTESSQKITDIEDDITTLQGAINEVDTKVGNATIPEGSYEVAGIWSESYYAARSIWVSFPRADLYNITILSAKYVSGANQMTDITSSTTITGKNALGFRVYTTSNADNHYGYIQFKAEKI